MDRYQELKNSIAGTSTSDWQAELLFFGLLCWFPGVVLLWTGVPFLYVAILVLVIEIGHLWNSF